MIHMQSDLTIHWSSTILHRIQTSLYISEIEIEFKTPKTQNFILINSIHIKVLSLAKLTP